ncbi:MAG: segregation and condensation protein A [Fusobacteriaceae bacterium]
MKMELILNLNNFKGPLDLLLHMVEKKKIKIEDVKISELIDEYLELIENFKKDSLELKVEFVLVASELLEIKALEIIKSQQKEEKEKELKKRLIEYKVLKELASEIGKLQNEYNISYSKKEGRKIMKKPSKEILLKNLKQMDLFTHYTRYMQKLENEFLEINLEKDYSLEKESEDLYIYLAEKERTLDSVFSRAQTKTHLIYMFLSLLELYKDGYILIENEIIKRRERPGV